MMPLRTLIEGRKRSRADEKRALVLSFSEVDFAVAPAIEDARVFVDRSDIAKHPFFALAHDSKRVVRCWVEQELTITNKFSQLLLNVASMFDNVYIRRHLMQIVVSEHGSLDPSGGESPHPVLLRLAGQVVGADPSTVEAAPMTSKYLDTLSTLCELGPLQALGAIGVGNELLLVSEYGAARDSYVSAYGSSEGAEFFDANISSDRAHYALCAAAASAYSRLYDEPADQYIEGARRAVDARLYFYNQLLKYARAL